MNTECDHSWKRNQGIDSNPCFKCKRYPDQTHRAKCHKCYLEGCVICIEEYFDIGIEKEKKKETKGVVCFLAFC